MSVKEKQEKSKKASEAHSLKHEEKPAQSISSLSSHIEQLQMTRNKLFKAQEEILKSIQHYKKIRDKYIDSTDIFLKGEGQIAEAEMMQCQNKYVQIRDQLKVVQKKLNEIYGSPQKPKKAINYVLKKLKLQQTNKK